MITAAAAFATRGSVPMTLGTFRSLLLCLFIRADEVIE
jgi:hypothetical protein